MADVSYDPMLSVFGLVQRAKKQQTLLNNRHAMLVISHEIENVVMLSRVRARIFSGFQRMSAFMPQIPRYQRLASVAESVYVFGYPDVTPPPIVGVKYIPLRAEDQLTKEWFLIADAPEYYTALSTEEINPNIFLGVWSFDEDMVTILQEWLTSFVDARPLGDLSKKRDYQRQVQLLSDTLVRMTTRIPGASLTK